MTTQINIVVDEGGLIQRNKEQTDGNRWLTLEKNGQKLTARRSKELRDQELAKQGKAPDGKPQSTTPAQPSFRRDEPTAQRNQQFFVGHCWNATSFTIADDVSTQEGAAWGYNGVQWFTGEPARPDSTGYWSGPAGSNTPTEKRESLVLQGDGSVIKTLPSFTFSATPSLSPQVPWEYTIEQTGYFPGIFPRVQFTASGTRTGRLKVNRKDRSWTLALPAGKDNYILLVFERATRNVINGTGMCYAILEDYASDTNINAIQADFEARWGGADPLYPTALYLEPAYANASLSIVNEEILCHTYAFVGSNDAIRQLSAVPALVQQLNPPIGRTPYVWYGATTAQGVTRQYASIDVHDADAKEDGTPLTELQALKNYMISNAAISPDIYKVFNDSVAFTDASIIKSGLTDFANCTADRSRGAYAYLSPAPIFAAILFKGAYPGASQFFYLKRRKNSSVDEPVSKPLLTLSPTRNPDLLTSPSSNTGSGVYNSRFHYVHDGGDPAYCRKMLLAMGFTAADLTP